MIALDDLSPAALALLHRATDDRMVAVPDACPPADELRARGLVWVGNPGRHNGPGARVRRIAAYPAAASASRRLRATSPNK